MGEMAQALKQIGSIKEAWLGKNPAGSWSFVGLVEGRLLYVKEDGSMPTIEQLNKIRKFGSIAMKVEKIKKRVFKSKEEAEKEARNIGQEFRLPIKETA